MYVTPILLLLLVSNVFAGSNSGAEDVQGRYNNLGINTKETSCVVPNFKIDLHSLLSLANKQQNENTPELIPLTDSCTNYYVSTFPASFNDAHFYCFIGGKKFATPDTPAALLCLRNALLKSGFQQDYWIAATNKGNPFFFWKTTYETANLTMEDWERGYPSGLSDRCVIINSVTRLLREFLCPRIQFFICEDY